ncbi:MAG: hypothetical protein AVO39_04965 [delta proteobacterium MLS_D]|jgi:long-chain acyl-CoA synthetase|nr:MAG: hypothetical protein AVO39_04965 [delta proteobacterium MLS_D]
MNIGRLADDNILRFGEYPFVYGNGRWYSNIEMIRTANRLGHSLQELGLGRDDRIGVQLLNCAELMQSFFAVFKIGGILVPLNPALRPDDLAYRYRDAGMSALITSPDCLDAVTNARSQAPELRHVILTGNSDPPEGTLSFNALIEGGPDELRTEERDNDDTAVIIYTAGTTGDPKGVMLTHYNWYTHVTGYYEQVLLDSWGVEARGTAREHTIDPAGFNERQDDAIFGVSRNRVSLITLPLFHGYGVFALNLEFLTGGKLVLLQRWDAEEAMRLIDRFKITEFRGVPTMYIQVLNHPRAGDYDLGSLKTCICGSAPMPLEIAEAWRERYGIHIWEGYGLSEATTVNSGNIAGRRPPRYGSIGKCYQKCNMMKIFDENSRELPTGETGEIVIKGPCVMKGYWNKPEATAETVRDGWLHTGDVGYADEDGYFYITDRKKDLIIRGGENIYPREVESVIYGHPAVLEAGVVGAPDPVYGETVKAFVALKIPGSITEADLLAFCKERLPSYKRPSSVQFMDQLPKSALGKILRRELRKIN